MITPSSEEIKLNNRSRSAKLRIAEKKYEKFLSFLNIDFLAGKDSFKNWKMLLFISLLLNDINI